jgi:hypothetical protein
MKTSESLKHFAPAFRKAQSEMESVKKDQSNPFFKSKYANIESIIDCVTPIFSKNSLSFFTAPCVYGEGSGRYHHPNA